jgi:hypothetical protein
MMSVTAPVFAVTDTCWLNDCFAGQKSFLFFHAGPGFAYGRDSVQ